MHAGGGCMLVVERPQDDAAQQAPVCRWWCGVVVAAAAGGATAAMPHNQAQAGCFGGHCCWCLAPVVHPAAVDGSRAAILPTKLTVACAVRAQERKVQHDPPGTYEGQTALHIAIVNRDFDMVKFLVQVSGKLARKRPCSKCHWI
eukprot:GHRQ01034606.1.p2 GENE.GHRQ01034606.1~~GHRQ01034606.1.p2  ORF type:complete len:145 (-),score=36.35 GHRQ01034606.1:7-441(-)